MTLSFCMVPELVMLAQQILAVVVAIGRTDNDVDVIFVRFAMFTESDATLMIELDDDHRTLDTVIKSAVVRHATHPAKVGVV
jgi:hypothetical protein